MKVAILWLKKRILLPFEFVYTLSTLTVQNKELKEYTSVGKICANHHFNGLDVLALKNFHVCKQRLYDITYIDVGDGCWRRNVLVTTMRSW